LKVGKVNTVFLLTSGDGSDGDEWGVISIHSCREFAEIEQKKYSEPQKNIHGVTYIRESKIEEWSVDENAAKDRTNMTKFSQDEVHAERSMSMSCPYCHRLIEVALLVASPSK
jgi:hypothetical protein